MRPVRLVFHVLHPILGRAIEADILVQRPDARGSTRAIHLLDDGVARDVGVRPLREQRQRDDRNSEEHEPAHEC
jgi:hypothetical protein